MAENSHNHPKTSKPIQSQWVAENNMPEMPKPWDLQHDDNGRPQVLDTSDQLKSYASKCVSAAREQDLEAMRAVEEALEDTLQSLCWLAFGECRNVTERRVLTASQAEEKARAAIALLRERIES